MGNELRALFKGLFEEHSPAQAVQKRMGEILATASKIGDPIKSEAERLHADLIRFLENPNDPKRLAIMKNHALKLEQETREL